MHLLCKKRMAVSIRRIILCGIIFTDKRISCQIQKHPRLFLSKIFFQNLRQFIFIQDFLDHQKSPYTQTTASCLSGFLFRHLLTPKYFTKVSFGSILSGLFSDLFPMILCSGTLYFFSG